jgi:hypothetical protein
VLGLPLSTLLSQAVVGFALEYEAATRHADISLAAAAVLHAIGDDGVPEGGFAPGGFCRAHGVLTVESRAPNRRRVVHLTGPGRALGEEYGHLSAVIEDGWRRRCGASTVEDLRSAATEICPGLRTGPPHYPLVSWLAAR